MTNKILKSIFIAFAFLAIHACSSDDSNSDNAVSGSYESGYFITNEGNFGTPSASVSFITENLSETFNNVFTSENAQSTLGDVLQSIAFHEDYAFLILNNSNKIEVVNRYTFKYVTTLTENLDKPRSAVAENGKLYTTNAGSKSVSVYNLADFSFNSNIAIGIAVENILASNGTVYVQNGSFGSGNKITLLNSSTDAVNQTITVGAAINSIALDNGILYALDNEQVSKINTTTNTIIDQIPLGALSGVNKMVVKNNSIYFISGSKIYSFNNAVTSFTDTPLVDTNLTSPSWSLGYGFAVENGKIFYSDVKGFTENSEVLIYDLTGQFIKSITTGVGSNNAYYNN